MSTVSEPSYRNRIGYQASLLGGFALLAAALLITGNISTRHAIAERQAEDLLGSLSQVLPAALHDNNLLADTMEVADEQGKPVIVYRALKQQQITGYAWRSTARGYAGDIDLLMGVDRDGRLLGVRILAHAETPGLGDRIEIEKDDWILGFNGRSLENTTTAEWQVKKDGGRFDQFSGATITPRAVVRAVHEGLAFFAAHATRLAALSGDKQLQSDKVKP